MVSQILRRIKRLPLQMLFHSWPVLREPLQDGYSILLPSPMDMPFLLRVALEQIAEMDTSRCRQIIVIPDGLGAKDCQGLRDVVADCKDSRITLVVPSMRDRFLARRVLRPQGGSDTHWLAIINGLKRVTSQFAYLHDADAFFVNQSAFEIQYAECLRRKMHSLGVTARWDPFFQKIGYAIPGTWELLFSVEWARSRSPFALKGRWMETPYGAYGFDTMLHPQYLDYSGGCIGTMDTPPEIVHFSATINSYRAFRNARGKPVIDELFRILLLAILEDVLSADRDRRVVPKVGELVAGLTDSSRPVHYCKQGIPSHFAEFRQMMEALCQSPVLAGERAKCVRNLLAPFDEHFGAEAQVVSPSEARMRLNGLG